LPSESAGGVSALALASLFTHAAPETSLDYLHSIRKWFTLSIPFSSNELLIRFADRPTGPWSKPRLLHRISHPWVTKHTFAYTPKHHRELSASPNELIVTFVANSLNESIVASDPRIYVPQALRVRMSSVRA